MVYGLNSIPNESPPIIERDHFTLRIKRGFFKKPFIVSPSWLGTTFDKGFHHQIDNISNEGIIKKGKYDYRQSYYYTYDIAFWRWPFVHLVFSLNTLKSNTGSKTQFVFLSDITVQEKNMGVGSQLVKVVSNFGERNGAKFIIGWFFPDEGKNKELKRFYIRQGFSMEGKDSFILKKFSE